MPLHIQNYLKSGKTFQDLEKEFGVTANIHPLEPMVILNYDQIESPKTVPLVRECRGLILHSQTYDLIAKSFNRFFNWGEVVEEMAQFDWQNFTTTSKEDGSLILLYFYKQWRVNTRNSFAQGEISHGSKSWEEVVCQALKLSALTELTDKLNPNYTYVCELASPWNKIVRDYREPKLYLLTIFQGEAEQSLTTYQEEVKKVAFAQPETFSFSSAETIKDYINLRTEGDPTFEGVVIRDSNNQRWKLKSATYLALHMISDGENRYSPKYHLPFILANEDGEFLSVYPEITELYMTHRKQVFDAYEQMVAVWQANWQIEKQKDFALAIVGKTKFTGLLFQLRKQKGKEQTLEDLKKMWRDSLDQIQKYLFD